jgi:hypothetical protein
MKEKGGEAERSGVVMSCFSVERLFVRKKQKYVIYNAR